MDLFQQFLVLLGRHGPEFAGEAEALGELVHAFQAAVPFLHLAHAVELPQVEVVGLQPLEAAFEVTAGALQRQPLRTNTTAASAVQATAIPARAPKDATGEACAAAGSLAASDSCSRPRP